ncbi:hypothetical protein ABZZ04_23435 [Streptomyces sp. NPDC006435]|uniref:hypothetical protein n=1 Tax=Streptomyces sp. NPDC006435 TaxID=3154300 RepID=UPI0033B894F1
MLEKASPGVVAERERIAARVRDELVAAGLPVVVPGLYPGLSQGAEVTVDGFDDDAGGVSVGWRSSPRLESRVLRAAELNLPDDPALLHQQVVMEAMLSAITAILVSAGFTVCENPNDYAPFTVSVPTGPDDGPSWGTRKEETAPQCRSSDGCGPSPGTGTHARREEENHGVSGRRIPPEGHAEPTNCGTS